MPASRTRNGRIIDAVACPVCRADAGQACRNPVLWKLDGPQPMRPHNERRASWVLAKQS